MSALTVWNYRVRSPEGEWWADVVLRSDGFFASVSDWQAGHNGYAYRRHNWGDGDFRAFVAQIEPDYLCGKIGGPKVYDGAATRKAIQEWLVGEDCDPIWVEAERALLEDLTHDEAAFAEWCGLTTMENPAELRCTGREPMAVAFCEKVLPRLQEQLRAELAAEAAATSASP